MTLDLHRVERPGEHAETDGVFRASRQVGEVQRVVAVAIEVRLGVFLVAVLPHATAVLRSVRGASCP